MTLADVRPDDDVITPAVVLLSGGIESAIVLAIARAEGLAPHALSFRYGQRHTTEIDAAACGPASRALFATRACCGSRPHEFLCPSWGPFRARMSARGSVQF